MDVTLLASELFRGFLLPPAGLFVLMALGWLIGLRWRRAGKVTSRAAIVTLLVLCTPVGANLLVAPLENQTRPLAPGSAAGAQAIVVLAAGRVTNAPEYGGVHIPDYIALARMRYAARLQHETRLPLLVSGGNRAQLAPHVDKASDMARAFREDFRTPVTWIEGRSETTAQNAEYSARILAAAGLRRILLVTDAMHMARAQTVFRQAGLEVVAAPTMFFRLDRIGVNEFIPGVEALRLSYYATYQWIGIAWYWLRFA